MDFKLLSGIFIEGLLSFLSPCVLPLIPLYMSYLAADNYTKDEEGNIHYKTLPVFISTVFFVTGISLSFILLALTVSKLKTFIEAYTDIISIIGGTLLIIFGLHQIGIIHIDVLEKERKLNLNMDLKKMNFLKAFLLGFVFSLGWTPCIGPLMANAILLASTNANGYLYILAYGLGMIIPFLITGLFTSFILNFINKNRNIVKWISKISGIILLLFGLYMIYDASKNITSLKNIDNHMNGEDSNQSAEDIENYLYTYEFYNEKGEKVKLSDYEGKYIFLNFTTSWCPWCKVEMPEYEEFAKNEEVECFYVMSKLNENTENAIDDFIKEYNPGLDIIMDDEGVMFYYCGISSYPTTYVITPEGKFIVYVQGAMNIEGFNNLLDYAKENKDSIQ